MGRRGGGCCRRVLLDPELVGVLVLGVLAVNERLLAVNERLFAVNERLRTLRVHRRPRLDAHNGPPPATRSNANDGN
jgi:hypothetical protein